MVRITDITLSCLDNIDNLPEIKNELLQFINFLIKMEVDAIELSDEMHRLLQPLPEFSSYVLPYESPRLEGLDDEMCGDYNKAFAQAKKHFGDNIEFCPRNRFHCATALAAEWIIGGQGNAVASSFSGIGSFAATEELIMILGMKGLRKPDKTYEFLPQMTELFCEITGKKIKRNKPVIGKRIFHIESGIHVDGIIKQPECYEPFPPTHVGKKRRIVLGKMSGRASIIAKLKQLDIQCAEADILYILDQVKIKATLKNGSIGKREFESIVKECLA